MSTGEFTAIHARAVVIATGGAGRVFRQNTNGGIVTGDGMALAYRHGVPLRDMEFVQYHPTCMPGTGILFTEACRGEGATLLNKDNYRYLQDYGLGPAEPEPRNKFMELGPRDRLSQAFWHEQQKGRTVTTPQGEAVWLDMRHLGEAKIKERLPLIRDLAMQFMGIDPALAPVPVRPAVHYTMGGILVDINTASPMSGLFAAGECSSVGIHGANRLGSNSLAELFVFGRVAGEQAAAFARGTDASRRSTRADEAADKALALLHQKGEGERHATMRAEMAASMEKGCGIYRLGPEMEQTRDTMAQLKQRHAAITLDDKSRAWNTDWVSAIELGFQLDVSEAMAHAALARKESRGAHQRIDGYEQRDDVNFLRHSLAHYQDGGAPSISFSPVKITRSPPGERAYGAQGEQLEAAQKDAAHV
jgi:fumarate reductase flavoprotein subunit